jgi:hypothetical protein
MNCVGRYVAGDLTLSIIGCDTVDSGINDRRVRLEDPVAPIISG